MEVGSLVTGCCCVTSGDDSLTLVDKHQMRLGISYVFVYSRDVGMQDILLVYGLVYVDIGVDMWYMVLTNFVLWRFCGIVYSCMVYFIYYYYDQKS